MQNHISTEKSKERKEQEKKEDEQDKAQAKHKKWADRMKDALQKDNQFKSALSLINMFDLLKTCCPAKIADRQQALQLLKSTFTCDENVTLQEVKAQ